MTFGKPEITTEKPKEYHEKKEYGGYTDKTDKKITRTVIIIGIAFVLITSAFIIQTSTAISIYNESGENYILWSWDEIDSYDIWIDNIQVLQDYTQNSTIATGLNPGELHLIEIREAEFNTLEGRQFTKTLNLTSETETETTILDNLTNPYHYQCWFVISLILFAIGLFHFRILWIIVIFSLITSLVLYIPNLQADYVTTAIMVTYASMILICVYGLRD